MIIGLRNHADHAHLKLLQVGWHQLSLACAGVAGTCDCFHAPALQGKTSSDNLRQRQDADSVSFAQALHNEVSQVITSVGLAQFGQTFSLGLPYQQILPGSRQLPSPSPLAHTTAVNGSCLRSLLVALWAERHCDTRAHAQEVVGKRRKQEGPSAVQQTSRGRSSNGWPEVSILRHEPPHLSQA